MRVKFQRFVIARGDSFMENEQPSNARFGKLENARLYENEIGAKCAIHKVNGAGAVAKSVAVTLEIQ
jgi:hypothetical protein